MTRRTRRFGDTLQIRLFWHAYLVYETLYLQLSFSNPGCFVPMNLRCPYPTIWQSYIGEALPFAPPASAVEFSQPRQFANGWTSRECLDFFDRSDDVEEHVRILADRIIRRAVSWTRALTFTHAFCAA